MMRVAASRSLLKKRSRTWNDELHRGVVVVQKEHAVQVRPLGARLGLGDDGGAGAPVVVAAGRA
jgi:hypothetical protein